MDIVELKYGPCWLQLCQELLEHTYLLNHVCAHPVRYALHKFTHKCFAQVVWLESAEVEDRIHHGLTQTDYNNPCHEG